MKRVSALPNVTLLYTWSIPDRQIHLTYPPDFEDLLRQAELVCPDLNAVPGFFAEVDDWVKWDRKVGYGLATILAWLCTGSPLEGLARLTLCRAQINYNHDSAIINLDAAIALTANSEGTPWQETRSIAKHLLWARMIYLQRSGRSFQYAESNPNNAHQYTELTAIDLGIECPDALPQNPMALSSFIRRARSENIPYWEILGGRILGDLLANEDDTEGALRSRRSALGLAVTHDVTAEVGHLRRLVGASLIAQGLQLRRAGKTSAARRSFGSAAAELRAAALFEAEDGCEYWAALSHYRLGDALRYQEEVEAALDSYGQGLELLEKHLGTQLVPTDRAVKRQIFASYAATALRTSFFTNSVSHFLAQLAADGSATAGELAYEIQALRLLPSDMRASLAETRGVFHLELAAARVGLDDYCNQIADRSEDRLRYYVGKLWTRNQASNVSARTEMIGSVASQLPASSAVVTIDICQFDSYFVRFGRDLRDFHAEYCRRFTEPGVAEAQSAFADALRAAKTHPAGAEIIKRAIDKLVTYYQDGAGHTVAHLLAELNADRLVLLPYRPAGSFPWHILEVDGEPLLQRFEFVYNQGFDMLQVLQGRVPAQAQSTNVTMVYDDAGADFFEGLASSASLLNIERVMRNPEWFEVASLAPLIETPPTSQNSELQQLDPLFGHVLVHLPTPNDWAAETSSSGPDESISHERPQQLDLFFACHGEFNPDRPLQSGLKLDAGSRTVNFSDILATLDLSSWRTVILGACETGLARRELATEQVGIGSAFLAAGVDYVVSSLWLVDAVATAILFDRFFAVLKEGASVPGALRTAELFVRSLNADEFLAWAQTRLPHKYLPTALRHAQRSAQPFSHPYYWAGFMVTGRP
ncbi:CHAT domain-containing protein [Krasilnikovia sp. M28-CT-15]|uniref:CHAT domain-containing protein n=1 Tax=Krasilnikovia sp. M28-CT-15 TaxID=3373540 RepID=UPI00399C7F7A